ncbi:DUF3024 domain-containing protein [Arenimonas alkanexedens]
MAFGELEARRLKNALDAFIERHRPPPHIRPELDLFYFINGQSVEIGEVRPRWRGSPGELQHRPVAKATYVKTTGRWRIFWKRSDLKWHGYAPAPHVTKVEEFLSLVAQDEFGCFFG